MKMSDLSIIDSIPIELFLKLLSYIKAKDLMICRAVCYRWKDVIDRLTQDEYFWKKRCEMEFGVLIQIARYKCRPGMEWSDLYRSLSLWSKLKEANEEQDEFCAANSVAEEIKNFCILRDGIIGVHKRAFIEYYNIESLECLKQNPIIGEYSRYTENEKVIALLSCHLHLFVVSKLYANGEYQLNITIDDVRIYLLLDHCIYYVNLKDDLHIITFHNELFKINYITHCNEGVLALGYKDHKLRLLTFQRKVFMLVDKRLVFVELLGSTTNLLHQLHNHNLLELLDWRIYFQWMFVLNHKVPQGPLQDIITTRSYGNVFFVGSTWGVLRIYYEPFTDGEFDLYNAQPVKQYNFMERHDCPVLSMCPILNIDVYEIDNGHQVLVAMPKKIAIISLTHNFMKTRSAAIRYPEPPSLMDQAETIQVIAIE